MPLSDQFRRRASEYARFVRWLPAWFLPPLMLAVTVAAYQVPIAFTVDVGSPQDQAYTRNFHGRVSDPERDYRWSGVYGYVVIPGTGGGRTQMATLTLDSERSARVAVIVNGALLHEAEVEAGWQTITVTLDENYPEAVASRDTVVEIRAPDYRTADAPNEAKGIKLDNVTVIQSSVGGLIIPPYAPTLVLAGAVFLLYLLIAGALSKVLVIPRARHYAFLFTLLLTLCVPALMLLNRVIVATAIGHALITIFTCVIVAWEVAWAAAKWWRLSPRIAGTLGVLTALAFGMRYFGMALPQSVIIDMPWHMKWLRTLLIGDWQALYFPGGLSRVPAEWGLDLLIPKSPLFYFAVAPLGALPFDLESAVKWVVSLLDAGMVAVAYWLARGCGAGARGALLAGALYALMPLAFRAFAYGILPTIFAQWVAVLLMAAVAGSVYGAWKLSRWLWLIVLASLALLAFPTVAVFTTLVLLAVSIAWWLSARRSIEGRMIPVRVGVVLVSGWLLAIVSYYGLYVGPVIASASALLGSSQSENGVARWPGGPAELVGWTADYVVSPLPWLIALSGLVLLVVRIRLRIMRPDARVWLVTVWLGIAPLFMIVNYRVDMIGKHLFFTMIPVAALGAMFLWGLYQRPRWGTLLTGIVLAVIGWQALVFWVERLVRAST